MSTAQRPTSSPPPASTVMSRASICVSRMISTSADAAVAVRGDVGGRSSAGATSWARRCSVQSPPRSTLVGTSGSGTIEPTDSPSPVNSNDVT